MRYRIGRALWWFIRSPRPPSWPVRPKRPGVILDLDAGILANPQAQRRHKSWTPSLIVGGVLVAEFAAVVALQVLLIQQVSSVDAKLRGQIDDLSKGLAEGLRSMRSESAAQTSAITNSIAAARQTPGPVTIMSAPVQP